MPKALPTFILLCACAGITACSSGGGGSAPVSSKVSSWPSNFNSQSYSVHGISIGGTQVRDNSSSTVSFGSQQSGNVAISNPNSLTTDADPSSPSKALSRSEASLSIKLDSSGNLQTASIKPSNNVFSMLDSGTDQFSSFNLNAATDQMTSANSSVKALLANPIKGQWEYQSFATWITGQHLTSSVLSLDSGSHGSMSAGFTTAANAIPTSGSATYSGNAMGHYQAYTVNQNSYTTTDSQGNITGYNYYDRYTHKTYFTNANLSANVNFANRQIALTTTSTQQLDLATGTTTAISNYDMTGSLAYNAGSNDINGSFYFTTSGSNTPIGTINAQFYGPNAEELGGTFSVDNATFTNSSSNTIGNFQGSFGAKR